MDVRVVANHDESGIRCAHTILTAIPHATGWLSPHAGQDVRDVLTTAPTLAMLQPITEWRMTPHASS